MGTDRAEGGAFMMPLRELFLFLLVAVIFASGNVLARYMISHWGIPPLFYGSSHYLIAA